MYVSTYLYIPVCKEPINDWRYPVQFDLLAEPVKRRCCFKDVRSDADTFLVNYDTQRIVSPLIIEVANVWLVIKMILEMSFGFEEIPTAIHSKVQD